MEKIKWFVQDDTSQPGVWMVWPRLGFTASPLIPRFFLHITWDYLSLAKILGLPTSSFFSQPVFPPSYLSSEPLVSQVTLDVVCQRVTFSEKRFCCLKSIAWINENNRLTTMVAVCLGFPQQGLSRIDENQRHLSSKHVCSSPHPWWRTRPCDLHL